jgi:hypothetical protein
MIRLDIQVFHRKNASIIFSKRNFFSFSKRGDLIEAYCSEWLRQEALNDILASKIVDILNYHPETGDLLLVSKFGYDKLKMEDLIASIFEKYDI